MTPAEPPGPEALGQASAVEEVVVPARSARALVLRSGQRLEIVDVEGEQVADLVAFPPDGDGEWLSPSHTRGGLQSLRLRVDGLLLSNRRRPLLRVVEDQVGVHDLLFAMCDEARYRLDYGIPDHPNCRDNLAQALLPWGVRAYQLPDPVNVFQNSPVGEDGAISQAPPRSRPGDRLVLEALTDLVVGVSACAQDQNPCNGWNPTAILLRILPGA
ncbi:MAG: DUF1989 domain-containing protein [Candidatus Dormibacteria bacterium]